MDDKDALEQKCPIWETQILSVESSGDSLIIDSSRAGGKFRITRSALEVLQSNPLDEEKKKVKLTDWLTERREEGITEPEITERILEDVKDRPEKEGKKYIDSFMLYLKANYEAYEKFYVGLSGFDAPGLHEKYGYNTEYPLMAYSGSTTPEELHEFLKKLEKDGYLEIRKGLPLPHCVMTRKGKDYAKKIRKEKNQKSVRWKAPRRWLKERGNAIFEGVMKEIILGILVILVGLLGASWLLKP